MSIHSFAPAALIIATGNRHRTLIAELQSQGTQVFRDVQSVSTADAAARIELVVIDNPTPDALKASEQAANAAMDADIHAPILVMRQEHSLKGF